MTESDNQAWCPRHRIWVGPAARKIDDPVQWTIMRPENYQSRCTCPDNDLEIYPVGYQPIHADGGPAFPGKTLVKEGVPESYKYEEYWIPTAGMTLRDWFAGMALMGYLSSPTTETNSTPQEAAVYARKRADALLKELGY